MTQAVTYERETKSVAFQGKRCTYRLVWQGRLLGINQKDIGRENRSDRQ